MIITSKTLWNTHTFEVVDKIPKNFFVWNIGANMMHDDYIPLCESLRPDDKECFDINQDTLKAIKLEVKEVMKLRKAAGYGITDLKTAEKTIASKRKAVGYIAKQQKLWAQETVEIFRRISE